MPAAWPRGRSVVPHILGGDSAVQIEAIWTYLSDGRQAKVPSGVQREAIELQPTDRPIIYRNFIEGLSPRGIATGFPEKVHFAWDAEQMPPRLIWHGAFIDASLHWSGRGAGNQSPLGDHIMTLPSGPPLAVLSSLDQPWPDVNPREHGFRFRGYSLNKVGTPTFRYTWNNGDVSPRGHRAHSQLSGDVIEHRFEHEAHGRVTFDLMRRCDHAVQQWGQQIHSRTNAEPLQQRVIEVTGHQPPQSSVQNFRNEPQQPSAIAALVFGSGGDPFQFVCNLP